MSWRPRLAWGLSLRPHHRRSPTQREIESLDAIHRHIRCMLRTRMERLNYHHLLYFWMVAREGTVARAASQLRLAQPTLSGQIRALEDRSGEKLFERAGRGLRLTEMGQVVFALRRRDLRSGSRAHREREGTAHRPAVAARGRCGRCAAQTGRLSPDRTRARPRTAGAAGRSTCKAPRNCSPPWRCMTSTWC